MHLPLLSCLSDEEAVTTRIVAQRKSLILCMSIYLRGWFTRKVAESLTKCRRNGETNGN